MSLTLHTYISGVADGSIDPKETINAYIQRAEQNTYNAFVRIHTDYADAQQTLFVSRKLAGAPIAIKDNIMTKDYISSCGSKMLEDYTAPYSATCFQNLEAAGGLMIGKTNMDEFALGSSNETSYFGPVTNPYGTDRVPGGSSGGSAVAVAADLVLGALGTDTGGSIRQPAALCGIVGFKPTYGMVSRYGVQALASSLDQVGTLTKNVADAQLLFAAICGYDPQDATSDQRADESSSSENINTDTVRIALPKQFLSEGLDSRIKDTILAVIEKLRRAGYTIDEIDLPLLSQAIPIYYTIMPAELSTNLARFDGVRYGLQKDTMQYDDIMQYTQDVRSEGFGEEAKRRILLGTYVLNAAHYEGFYLKAEKVRQTLRQQLHDIYQQYDMIIGPTTPDIAWKFGKKSDDPIKMYMSDLYTAPANLCGLPAISLPAGMVDDQGEQLPVGLQLMADQREDEKLLQFAQKVEAIIAM